MKKRIAFVTNVMVVGGVEKALIELLNCINFEAYEVVLWVRKIGGDFSKLINPNIDVKCWGNTNSKEDLLKFFYQRKIIHLIKFVWFRLLLRIYSKDWVRNELYTAKALGRLDSQKYDCVIAYQGMSPAVIGTALYRFMSPNTIAWIHGEDAFSKEHLKFMEREYLKFTRIFCVSNTLKNLFNQKFCGTENISEVFYNLLNPNKIIKNGLLPLTQPLDSVSIVTVGRLAKEKGQQLIPRTTRLLLDAGYDIHWYLVGDGPLRETVESEIAKYNVADRVILLGTQMNPYPYIKNCDIYVQPSLSEGWCLTVQEARILQKPIVTTPLPVMHEQIISGENGLIAEDTTPEALAESIKLLLDHPELREKFVENLSHEVCDNSGELQKLYDFIES